MSCEPFGHRAAPAGRGQPEAGRANFVPLTRLFGGPMCEMSGRVSAPGPRHSHPHLHGRHWLTLWLAEGPGSEPTLPGALWYQTAEAAARAGGVCWSCWGGVVGRPRCLGGALDVAVPGAGLRPTLWFTAEVAEPHSSCQPRTLLLPPAPPGPGGCPCRGESPVELLNAPCSHGLRSGSRGEQRAQRLAGGTPASPGHLLP